MKDIFDVEIKVGDVVAFAHQPHTYFALYKGKVVKLTAKTVFVEYQHEILKKDAIVRVAPYKCAVMKGYTL